MRQCSVAGYDGSLLAKGLCSRHYSIRKKYGDENHPVKRIAPKGSGATTVAGYRLYGNIDGRQYQHILVAEKALGKKLPPGAVVHHVDGDPANNAPDNLVVCPDQAYHMLLHVRQRAFDACGNAAYKKCMNCGRWDDPTLMKWHKSTTYYHKPASLCKGV